MAKRTTTTTPSFTEPPTASLRAMFARFTALVGSLVELTSAERDLGGYQGQDPALSAFTGAVDTARSQTLTHCAAVLAGETEDEMAHGMQTVARMVRTVLTADTFSEVAIIRNLLAMLHPTQELEPPANPARFTWTKACRPLEVNRPTSCRQVDLCSSASPTAVAFR